MHDAVLLPQRDAQGRERLTKWAADAKALRLLRSVGILSESECSSSRSLALAQEPRRQAAALFMYRIAAGGTVAVAVEEVTGGGAVARGPQRDFIAQVRRGLKLQLPSGGDANPALGAALPVCVPAAALVRVGAAYSARPHAALALRLHWLMYGHA